MKYFQAFLTFTFFALLSCSFNSTVVSPKADKYIFFLHNRFLESHTLEEVHPRYGKVEYEAILNSFRQKEFNIISEHRHSNVNARTYALGLTQQINELIAKGTSPNAITVIGTSKGGYIAQYVSTLAHNPNLNFVFIACYQDSDLVNIPEIQFCGNILNIYEKSDPYGVSAIKRNERSECNNQHFKEIELNTGLEHGFLFKAMDEWIQPCVRWASGEYELGK